MTLTLSLPHISILPQADHIHHLVRHFDRLLHRLCCFSAALYLTFDRKNAVRSFQVSQPAIVLTSYLSMRLNTTLQDPESVNKEKLHEGFAVQLFLYA